MLAGLPKIAGVPIWNQVTPWLVDSKTLPVVELMSMSLSLTGLTTRLAISVDGHWLSTLPIGMPFSLPGSRRFGTAGSPLAVWSSPKVRLMPSTLTKLVYWPPWPAAQNW